MIIIPFKLEHLQGLALQPAQVGSQLIAPGQVLGHAFTALSEGQPVACAGLYEIWPGRALAWTYLGENVGREFLAVHRAVRRHLEEAPWRRVEAYVESGFTNGHRWVGTLGFKFEGLLRGFMADGQDMALYARVR